MPLKLTPSQLPKFCLSLKSSAIAAVSLGVLLGISACSTAPKILKPIAKTSSTPKAEAPKKFKTDISAMSVDERSQLYYSLLLGKLAEKKGLIALARSNYEDALDKTRSPRLASQAAKLALVQKDYTAAKKAMGVWRQVNKDDSGPNKIELLIALHQSEPKKAYSYLEKLLKKPNEQWQKIVNTRSDEDDLTQQLTDDWYQQLIQLAYYQVPDDTDLETQVIDFIQLLTQYNQQYNQLGQPFPASLTAEAFLRLNGRSSLSDLEKIHKLLDQSLKLSPNFMGAITTKAEAYRLLSSEKSQAFMAERLKTRHFTPKQLFYLGGIAYKQEQFESATIAYRRLLDLEPDNEQYQYLLAGSLYANDQYQEALDYFYPLALNDYRKEVSAFYCADAAQHIDDITKALVCFEMVPYGKYFLRARNRIAEIYADKEMYQEGAKSLQTAQGLVDFNLRQLLMKFEVNYLIKHQQLELAKQRLDKAVALEPHNTAIYYLQLLLAEKSGSEQHFLTVYQDLMTKAPDNELRKDLVFSAVNLLHRNEQHQKVINLISDELKNQPRDIDLLYTRAMSYEPLKQYNNLIRDLRKVLLIDPDHTDSQNALGYTLADLNRNLPEALELITTAYEKDPENIAFLDSMGWVYYRLGDLDLARKYISRSYKTSPEAEIAAHYGEILWQLGDKDEAIEVWRKALEKTPENAYILRTLKRFPEAGLTT